MNTVTMVNPEELAKLAYLIASQMVDHPRELCFQASRKNTAGGTVIVVRAPGRHQKIDHGKLIGASGNNYRALQTLLREAARRHGEALNLDIVDPGGAKVVGDKVPLTTDSSKDHLFAKTLALALQGIYGSGCNACFSAGSPLVGVVGVESYSAKTVFTILHQTLVNPEVLSAFQVLWKAIGRNHGRDFVVNAHVPREKEAA